jgi:ABC-type multidrug transport system ATPase subunit
MLAVEFTDVTKSYDAVKALAGISFAVERGQMFGVIGPDGAGKTTAIRIACGLLRADGGTVRVLGNDPVRQHRRITGAVGYLSQRFSLYGDLTIDENRREHRVLRRDPRRLRLPGDARPAARHDPAHRLSQPAGRSTFRRDEAEAGTGLHADP